MKIEFIREEGADGSVCFYTILDGMFIDGSLMYSEILARKMYNNICNNAKPDIQYPVKEVLESKEI